MTTDEVVDAAKAADTKRLAVKATAMLIQRRLDPKLLAADAAKIVLARSVRQLSQIKLTPRQRKRALATAGVAAAAVVGLRVLYRNMVEKNAATPSLADENDVKLLP